MSHFFTRALLALALVCATIVSKSQNKLPQLGKDPLKEIVKTMTLEEKAQLVIGTGLRFAGSGTAIGEADGRVPGAAGNTMNINRFGIVGTVLSDGPAGLRIDPFHKGDTIKSYYATAWPVGTLLASTWDTSLVKKVGRAFGNEIKEYGVDVILAPGMNIQRNPLNGRNFEYFSEDPIVSGNIGAAMISGIQSNGVGTSMKHFVANNEETNRSAIDAVVSERALREIYLRGFEIAVKKAQPFTVMTSYNKVNGTYTSERYDLITNILREEWGFKGMVMTDWYGGRDPIAQMKAGNDLIEPGSKSKIQNIVDAVNNGSLDVKDLDRSVEHILNFILKTPSFHTYQYANTPDLKAHALIARKAAAEGIILLKNNNNVLPLNNGAKLALFGNGSYETIRGGTGSGEVNTTYTISIIQGLKQAGFTVWPVLTEKYNIYIQQDKKTHPKKGMTLGAPRMMPEIPSEELPYADAAENNDVGIFTISRNAGEGADRKVENDFNLTEVEKAELKAVADAFHAKDKKLLVILNIGGVIETASWRNLADGILLPWQPGEEGGNAIADVLSGAVNPSGKLAQTFPLNYQDVPSASFFPGEAGTAPEKALYKEGIYVGYRYYDSFGVKTAYSFGYGLSYTKFKYANLKLSSGSFNKKITATVLVTNTGSKPGSEVVEIYLSAPNSDIDKPEKELKGFAKTRLLAPGISQKIIFTLNASDLASFNTAQSSWVADKGKYTVKIAASSEDVKLTGSFLVSNKIIVEKVHKALVPQVPIDELKKMAK